MRGGSWSECNTCGAYGPTCQYNDTVGAALWNTRPRCETCKWLDRCDTLEYERLTSEETTPAQNFGCIRYEPKQQEAK